MYLDLQALFYLPDNVFIFVGFGVVKEKRWVAHLAFDQVTLVRFQV